MNTIQSLKVDSDIRKSIFEDPDTIIRIQIKDAEEIVELDRQKQILLRPLSIEEEVTVTTHNTHR